MLEKDADFKMKNNYKNKKLIAELSKEELIISPSLIIKNEIVTKNNSKLTKDNFNSFLNIVDFDLLKPKKKDIKSIKTTKNVITGNINNDYYYSDNKYKRNTGFNIDTIGQYSFTPKVKNLPLNSKKLSTPNNKTNLVLKHNKSAILKSRNISRTVNKSLSMNSIKNTKNENNQLLSSISNESLFLSKNNLFDKTLIINNDVLYNIFSVNLLRPKTSKESLYQVFMKIISALKLIDKRFVLFNKSIKSYWSTDQNQVKSIKEKNKSLMQNINFYENKFEEIKKSLEEKYFNEREELKLKIVLLEDNLRNLKQSTDKDLTLSELKITNQSHEISIYNPNIIESNKKNFVPKLNLCNLADYEQHTISKTNIFFNSGTNISNNDRTNDTNVYKKPNKCPSKSNEKKENNNKISNYIQLDNKKIIKNLKILLKNDRLNYKQIKSKHNNLELNFQSTTDTSNKIFDQISKKRSSESSKVIDFLINPSVKIKSRNQSGYNNNFNSDYHSINMKHFTQN